MTLWGCHVSESPSGERPWLRRGGRGVHIHKIQIPGAETDSGRLRLQGRDCQEHGHETAAL